ncbi:MAG: Ribosomal protein modification protein [Candidatus Hydrogenedentota bacterium]|jgi:ribosomal protein S6--L-glutamate ligase
MKIGILSRARSCCSTRRLCEAAEQRGHEVRVLDTLKFAMSLEKQSPELHYRGNPLSHYDAVIPRIGASITFYGLAVVRQFEQMGVYSANSSIGIAVSRDKLRSMQVLSRHDVGLPPTCFVRDGKDVLPAIERLGGVPVIIKLLEGTQGVGVILAETTTVAEAIIQTLHRANQNVLIQKFVRESKGRDIRALVVGDRVVAAMRRRAQGSEFRSNVHRGATVEPVTLDDAYTHTAVRAAQIIGLTVAGVDMLESDEGPQVMEVNSSPGLEGIEKATGVDVAGEIIANIEERVLFPDVDLKQRLRLAAGYGVVEFHVHDMPWLEGHRLRDSGLEDRNIHVLSIDHKSGLVANPKGDAVVERGDVLLCFGPLAELRAIAPHHSRKPGARRGKPRGKATR